MYPRKQAKTEEIGDLFVTEEALLLKLMPSKKSARHPIRWFAGGGVSNVRHAAKDIAYLVGKLQGRTRVVRHLTVMTTQGAHTDLDKTGLFHAVTRAGFSVLK